MSQLTDNFVITLINNGMSEEEISFLLSSFIADSIKEIYSARRLDKNASQILENNLQKLLDEKAPQEKLFQTLGISHSDLHNLLKMKLMEYLKVNNLCLSKPE